MVKLCRSDLTYVESVVYSHVWEQIILNKKTANVGLSIMSSACGVRGDQTLVVPLLVLYCTLRTKA